MDWLLDAPLQRPLWNNVAEDLRRAILVGRFPAGSRVPNERDLTALYRVSRNTLRRAVAELESYGMARREQGRASFVPDRIDYALGNRTRLTDYLAGYGLAAERRILDLRELPSRPGVSETLGLPPGDPAWRLVSEQTAGGSPIKHATTWFVAARFPGFGARRRAEESVTAILQGHGIADYVRAWTRILARRATEAEARALRQLTASSVFEINKLDATPAGGSIAFGRAVRAADRMQFHMPGAPGPDR